MEEEKKKKSSKIIIAFLIIILIVILSIGGYFIYNLNNRMEQTNKAITDLKNEKTADKAMIENMIKENTNNNSQTSNTETTNQANTTNQLSTEEIIKEQFLAKLEEINNKNSEKLLDYRVDKVKILSESEKNNLSGYTSRDILATVTYSVKPKNVNTSGWDAGNGEKSGEWIINKTACECLRSGKLVNTTGFDTSF